MQLDITHTSGHRFIHIQGGILNIKLENRSLSDAGDKILAPGLITTIMGVYLLFRILFNFM